MCVIKLHAFIYFLRPLPWSGTMVALAALCPYFSLHMSGICKRMTTFQNIPVFKIYINPGPGESGRVWWKYVWILQGLARYWILALHLFHIECLGNEGTFMKTMRVYPSFIPVVCLWTVYHRSLFILLPTPWIFKQLVNNHVYSSSLLYCQVEFLCVSSVRFTACLTYSHVYRGSLPASSCHLYSTVDQFTTCYIYTVTCSSLCLSYCQG